MNNRSPYHLGFSTLETETSLDNLPVRGTVPPWLTGTLVRTGPAKFEVGDQRYHHWLSRSPTQTLFMPKQCGEVCLWSTR
jgi:carotenoid cleavage dioxygenase-like enzyme